ncbi:hypothetical protein C2G38_2219562 [Gigaspora rosea]|uniref:Uncharacterized protein n=1 Tax=Gigaspora rosea TaxID=44941 RepID=A0A397UDN9_9GLOM|nr:hypothetical protein C2G38_2219562 [Gigaspora rosea]
MFLSTKYVEIIEAGNLIQEHWKTKCSKSQDRYARKIQYVYREFRKRTPTNAWLAWLSLPNDNIPEDEKFLKIAMYRRCNPNMVSYFINNKYEEYYISYDWIDRKKIQL